MTDKLIQIRKQIEDLISDLNTDKSLPVDPITVVVLVNAVRSSLIDLDCALRRRHNERQLQNTPILSSSPLDDLARERQNRISRSPSTKWPSQTTQPAQALDPQTRADIDDTP